MKITKTVEDFILFWGEMGVRWGVNRSVAQIHALLYLSEDPMSADEIQDSLKLARSNVSNSIKELLSWKLIELVHIMGDRKDRFKAYEHPWDMFLCIVEGRKQREIDPTLEMLRRCSEEMKKDKETPKEVKEKIEELHGFLEDTNRWFEDMKSIPTPVLKGLMKLGSKVMKFVK